MLNLIIAALIPIASAVTGCANMFEKEVCVFAPDIEHGVYYTIEAGSYIFREGKYYSCPRSILGEPGNVSPI